jgi:imidazolonepropionase-like amidohydrolase
MGMDAEVGTLEPGKRADLILVEGNPLQNIHDIRKVRQVMTGGRLYETAPLWRMVGFTP